MSIFSSIREVLGRRQYAPPAIPPQQAEMWRSIFGVQAYGGAGVSVTPGRYSETYVPYTELPVVSPIQQNQGIRPPVDFPTLRRHWSIPQVNEGIDFWRNVILGTGITINCQDEEAKMILEKWMLDTNFMYRLTITVQQTLVYGVGMMVKQRTGKRVTGIEDLDISNVLWYHPDKYGNPLLLKRIYAQQGTYYDHTINWKNDIILRFRPDDQRSFFGLSRFHALSVWQDDGNTAYKSLGDAIISMNDAVAGTAESTIAPKTFLEPKNKNPEALAEYEELIKRMRPRQIAVVRNTPDVNTIDQNNRVQYEPVLRETNERVAEALGFPYGIMRGDFTSRASSKTTEELWMKTVRWYQHLVLEMIVEDVFKDVLMSHESGKWATEEAWMRLELTAAIDEDTKVPFTSEEMLAMYQAGVISLEEYRQYARNRGADLFTEDDELMARHDAENQRMADAVAARDSGPDPQKAPDGAAGEAYYPQDLVPRADSDVQVQQPRKYPPRNAIQPYIDPTQQAAQKHATRRMDAMSQARKDQGGPAFKLEYHSRLADNTCKECRRRHGQRFWYNDPRRPHLPRHPHCQCWWTEVGQVLKLGQF